MQKCETWLIIQPDTYVVWFIKNITYVSDSMIRHRYSCQFEMPIIVQVLNKIAVFCAHNLFNSFVQRSHVIKTNIPTNFLVIIIWYKQRLIYSLIVVAWEFLQCITYCFVKPIFTYTSSYETTVAVTMIFYKQSRLKVYIHFL